MKPIHVDGKPSCKIVSDETLGAECSKFDSLFPSSVGTNVNESDSGEFDVGHDLLR